MKLNMCLVVTLGFNPVCDLEALRAVPGVTKPYREHLVALSFRPSTSLPSRQQSTRNPIALGMILLLLLGQADHTS